MVKIPKTKFCVSLQKRRNMKILVCISNVPDTTTKVTFNSDNTQFNTAGVQYILNPYDEIALARALELAEGGKGTVTVIHVGGPATEPTIRKALAIGADDAVRIDAEPLDGFFVATQIAQYAKGQNFDLILAGRESIDYNNGQVAGLIAELLDIPVVPIIKQLDIDGTSAIARREIDGGTEVVSVAFPAVFSCAEGVAEPKIPNMRGIMSARTKPLQVISATDTQSLSKILTYSAPPVRSSVKLFSTDELDKLAEALHTEAKII